MTATNQVIDFQDQGQERDKPPADTDRHDDSLSESSSESRQATDRSEVWRELNVSVDRSTSFKLNIFSCYLDSFTDILKVNDVISISYAELGLVLVSIGYEEMLTQSGAFAITEEGAKAANVMENSNGMYRIENFDSEEPGGFLEWEKYYRLKHLS